MSPVGNLVAMDEYDAKRLLAQYGVAVAAEERVRDAREATTAAERIGYPVALKGCGVEFLHKTELGLVHLGLRDADAVEQVARQLAAAMGGQGELLVQQMISGKREFLIGMTRDAQFGPVLTFGLGGIFAEALADVALRIAPLSQADALSMLDEIRAHALLGDFRGMPAVDRRAIARAILGVARLAQERPDIEAIDINPLIVQGAQPVAVDALILWRPSSAV
jgi:succinyl-CoA synthetase beta subunit